MTLQQLIKQYRQHGIALTSKGLNCTFEMKGATTIRNISQGENFIKAQFTSGRHIMEVTAWTKPE